jgi:hypothetical protein
MYKDATDQTIYVSLKNSTTGMGLTGLAYNTASLVCYYTRARAAAAALTLATQTTTGAHSDGGFVEVSSANCPGLYRLDLSDAIVATGVDSVHLSIKGATNLLDADISIQLYSSTPNDASGVTTLLTRLGTPSDLGSGATVAGNLVDIESQTDDIGAAGAGLTVLATQASVDTIDNFLDTEIAAILALLDDPRTEPGQGAPPVNPDMATKIDYLYKAWRNKKDNNGTETKLYADDATTVDHKQATTESGGTVTKGEWATGA